MVICRCNEVTQAEIKSIFRKHPHVTLAQVTELTGASTKCGRCRPLLEKTYEKLCDELPKDKQLSLSF
jgi:bacterioferritin-associated ferredoxin